jgi:hypothetical protein
MYKVADCDGDIAAENVVYSEGIVMLLSSLQDYRDFVQEYSFKSR